jgi:cation transport ATPase
LYNGIYYQYKDSIEKEKKVQELSQEEAEAEQLRTERLEKEQEEIKRRNNNIQYVGITLGIVLLFLALVILGMFKVSTGLIKAIGFFVFLMLFEFIFLIFKKKIYSITHGEPWKDLLFMIALAALLVPLHHWLEHRVLHYLTSHNRLTSAGQHIRKKLFRRTKEDFDSTSP